MPIQMIGNMSASAPRPGRGAGDAPAPSPPGREAAVAPAGGVDPLANAIEAINKMLDPMARGLQFSIDQSTGKTVVKLIDRETNEVLREMPSRELLSIARALDRVQGLLFNGHA